VTGRHDDKEMSKVPEAKKPMGDEVAVMETNHGTIKLKFFPDAAPKAVENFKGLAKKGYYDGVTFHRVIDGFMIQGGDPRGTGTGGESLWGKPFEDEFSPKVRFDRKGLLAMANAGPRTNGSQFFITLGPTPHLNDRHTIFGEVISGMDVVEKIGKVAKGRNDKPTEPVVMNKVNIESHS
jgi:cyclophilin family peptidyl-prolyl cis-trans isomerase